MTVTKGAPGAVNAGYSNFTQVVRSPGTHPIGRFGETSRAENLLPMAKNPISPPLRRCTPLGPWFRTALLRRVSRLTLDEAVAVPRPPGGAYYPPQNPLATVLGRLAHDTPKPSPKAAQGNVAAGYQSPAPAILAERVDEAESVFGNAQASGGNAPRRHCPFPLEAEH
jgi:hypothetical protein